MPTLKTKLLLPESARKSPWTVEVGLTAQGVPFPKTHNIRELVEMLPAGTQLNLSEDQQDELTDYATGARYPGWGDISLTDSQRAVAIARRLRGDVRKLLPKAALRRRKR
jgi:HEPN domain-containing protein